MFYVKLEKMYSSFLYHFTMALARWARSEDPKPYTLYTRREVDDGSYLILINRYFIFCPRKVCVFIFSFSYSIL